jgi:CheY-like chemotaxis protein
MERKTLLLVDDVDLFLELEKSFLSRQSFALHTARSGREALEKVGTLHPHLILLDLFMPDLNGDAVCRQVKASPATRDTPVIIISTDTPEVRQICFAAGADDFLPKPLQRETLLRAIEEMLRVSPTPEARVVAAQLWTMFGEPEKAQRVKIR